MLIQRKLKDGPNGTFITMSDNTPYAFLPNDDGHHVAEIENPAHIERLLSIPEGFCIYKPDAEQPAPSAPPAPDPDPDPDPDDGGPADEIPLDQMTETDLRALYEREIGRAAHWNARMETMIDHIKAHRERSAQPETQE